MNWYGLLKKEEPESPMFTGKKKQEEPEWVKTAKEKTNTSSSNNISPKEPKNDEFLEGLDFYTPKEEKTQRKTTVSMPDRQAYSQFAPKEQGIMFHKSAAEEYDDFVKAFNDPYGEKEEAERREKFADIRANADKRDWTSQSITDPFLDGFNQSEENIWKKTLNSAKTGATDVLKKTKEKGIEFINSASTWANKKGFLDDVTNTFFKVSDISQDYPKKSLPTDLAHYILANANRKENQKVDLSRYEAHGGYINDQNVGGSKSGKIRYGNGTFNKNGCEIIAVNNALVSLGNRKDIRDIAKDFETDGQVFFGALGTSPYAIDDYFKKQGYNVKTFTGDKNIYNVDIPDADTYIISFWNSDKATDAIHTVSFDKLPNGKYRIYNENGSKILEVDSLNKYLRDKKRVPLVLHCIKKG